MHHAAWNTGYDDGIRSNYQIAYLQVRLLKFSSLSNRRQCTIDITEYTAVHVIG